ncbi:uncharacterized protein LOC111490055 isoform X1 [Cucurbita maxima]|uniref:Uncharacterized protein LOC111490055 isoform X1 n=2 Tax=Cucurbita maxima TaxID=3661 RepID=A0A6J1K0R1_CUCMA|nr:uncharacterized protein LOC111490055 isoform X1 [Cucurbita maxima]
MAKFPTARQIMATLSLSRFDLSSIGRSDNRRRHLHRFRRQGKSEASWALCRRNMVAVKSVTAFYGGNKEKGSICTADELHYVSVPNSDWKLALWRYNPSLQAASRNHPLLLLSGVGSNALGYDLSPESSFARYMSNQGYDTWILEVRGSGLSTHRVERKDTIGQIRSETPEKQPLAKIGTYSSSEGSSVSSKHGQESTIATQLGNWNKNLINIIEGAQQLGPLKPFNLQGVTSALEDFQEQLDVYEKYDWDFDHYLEEDVPAAMEYIRNQSKPNDGKLLAIGHSMGGILLYATISRCSFNKVDPQLASVVTLASSLDYRPSNSSLRLLLPLRDPAQAFNVPVFPIGPLLAIAHPLASRPPYLLYWLKDQISVEDMLDPTLLEKLVLNGFESVPAKVLLQLSSVFEEGGLRDRNGTFQYNDHLRQTNVPILAIAGDQDPICPPEAVYETVKGIPREFVSYRVLGKPGGPHYSHYDLVGSRLASSDVYPLITDFLNRHDVA